MKNYRFPPLSHAGHLPFAHVVTVFFLRGTSLSGSRHQLHVTIVIFIFFVSSKVDLFLACVIMSYLNRFLRHLYCINLFMSPLLSINILKVTLHVFIFQCSTLLIRSFCLIQTVFQRFLVHSPVVLTIFWCVPSFFCVCPYALCDKFLCAPLSSTLLCHTSPACSVIYSHITFSK